MLICLAFLCNLFWQNSNKHSSYNVFTQIVLMAQEENYDDNSVKQIIVNLHATIPKKVQDRLKIHPYDDKESIQRFLRQFKDKFHNAPEKNKSFCNWFSWLLIKLSLDHPTLFPERDKILAKVQFEKELNKFCQLYKREYEKYLGEKYITFEPSIDEGLKWFTCEAMRKYQSLQDDPFFPAFKRSLSDDIFQKANKKILESETVFPEYLKPKEMMVLTEEIYLKKILTYFTSLPNLWFCLLVQDEMITEMRNDGYLGRGDYFCLGQSKRDFWPIAVWYSPHKKEVPRKNDNMTYTE